MRWVLPLLIGAGLLVGALAGLSASPGWAALGLVIGAGFIWLSYHLRVRR